MFYHQLEVRAGVVGGEFDEFGRRPGIGEKAYVFQIAFKSASISSQALAR